MSKTDLFLELASPDAHGYSRWVATSEFEGKYEELKFGNGGSWCRDNSTLAKKYKLGIDKSKTSGNKIDAIRTEGFNTEESFNQTIRQDIKDALKDKKCVMLGVNGKSENTRIEIDHKDGRKNDSRVSDPKTQKISDFQPLCKAANDVKRQICKKCKETNKRWDAKNIAGNPFSYYEGDENYSEDLGCKGCYQYDPVEYRKSTIKKITLEAVNYVLRKFYPGDFEK